MDDVEKKCPQCAELVKAEAKICRFCGHDFLGASVPGAATVREPKAKSNTLGKGCLTLFGILLLLYTIGSLFGPGDQSTAAIKDPADAAATVAVQAADAVNSEGTARIDLNGPQANAKRTAEQYLAMSGFSRKGLIEQLSSDAGNGYDIADATAAVDSLAVDWNEQAARSAKDYLNMTGFSCRGLIEQLSSSAGSKYTMSEARYGAEQAGAC